MSNYGTRAHELASNVAEHEHTTREGNRAVNVRASTCTACDTSSALECGDMHARGHARRRRVPVADFESDGKVFFYLLLLCYRLYACCRDVPRPIQCQQAENNPFQ